jgi:multiple sugar transport system substrate-binding protein
VILGAGAGSVGPLAARCTQDAGSPERGPQALPPARLFFLGRGQVTYQQTFEELSTTFTREFPSITVEYTHEAGSFDQKYAVLAASDQTPDVGFSTVAQFKGHLARGAAAYLDELAKRDKQFKEGDYDAYWLAALKYKGRLGGLPWDPGMVVLHYNKNVLQRAGVSLPDARAPLTWEQTIELAKRLTVDSGAGVTQWGLEAWWARFWWHVPRQLGLADVYLGDENVLKLDHPTAIEGLQWLADLRAKHRVSRPPGYPGPATGFETGKLALDAGGVWRAGTFRTNMQDDWDWAPLPQFAGKKRVTTGQASPVILGNASKAKDASWELMKYLAGPIGQELAMERGISQPILKQQHTSPAFTKHRPPVNAQVAVTEVQYGVPSPYGPTYTEVDALVAKVMDPVYKGEQTARQAITAAMPELRAIIDESKRQFG